MVKNMEILYGIVLLIVFVAGFGIGITVPFFVKKYMQDMLDKISAETKINNKEEDKPITVQNLTQDIKDEWMFGYTSRKEEGE
jgi:predicted membrane protein